MRLKSHTTTLSWYHHKASTPAKLWFMSATTQIASNVPTLMEHPITTMSSGVVIPICHQKTTLVFSSTRFWPNAPTANLPGLLKTEDASRISIALKISTSSSENASIPLITVWTSISTEEGARNVVIAINWSIWREAPKNANSFNPPVDQMSMFSTRNARRK